MQPYVDPTTFRTIIDVVSSRFGIMLCWSFCPIFFFFFFEVGRTSLEYCYWSYRTEFSGKARYSTNLKNTIFFFFQILFHEAFHHKYRAITRLTKGCPSHSDLCPLDVFMRRSKIFLPVNIKQECLPKKTNRSTHILCDMKPSNSFKILRSWED